GRLARPWAVRAYLEFWVVTPDRRDADDDRVGLAAQPVRVGPRGLTRDPARGARGVSDLPVEGHRRLECNVRPPLGHGGEEHAVLAQGLLGEHAPHDLDSRALEIGRAHV